MRRVRTSELIPGMYTAEDVYSFNNQLVVAKGTVLTDEIIAKLEYYSVLSIHIDENAGIAYVPEVVEESETSYADSFASLPEDMPYSQKIKSTKEFKEFEKSFIANSEALDGHLHEIIEGHSIDTNVLLSSVTNLIGKNSTSISMFDMLHSMRSYDNLTYVHSMSVSIICNIFGRWLKLNPDDIDILTIAGLLHDIGKLVVPEEIIKKPGKLTEIEYNKVKAHTLEGYKILKNVKIDNRIKDAALLHHERCDGTGYPLGVGEDKISDFAKIIAIADVYDAMTAARVYRGPMCPFKVISIFEKEGLQKYDSKFILTFLENIGQTYMNNRVRLSDGREGDIVLIHNNAISRPLVKCLDGSFVDLVDYPDLSIDELV